MNFKDFTKDAIRTESRPEKLHINPGAFIAALVLAQMTAQAVDMFKKGAFYGKPVDQDKLHHLLVSICKHGSSMIDGLHLLNPENRDVQDTTLFSPEGGEVKITDELINVRLTHAFVGDFTESGEKIEALLTSILENKPIDAVNVGEEYGDSDWYKAIAFDELGLDENQIREAVIAKLRNRYGDKFDADKATNRDLAQERETLEAGIVAQAQ